MAAGGIGISGLGLLLLLFFGGGFAGSVDVVPLPEDPVVAQVAPAECLFYSSWTGKTKASPDATSSTERLFSDSKFVEYLKHVDELLHEAVSRGMVSQGIGKEHIVAGFYLLEHLQSHAGSLYVSSVNALDKQLVGGLVVRFEDDERDTLVASLERLLKLVPAEIQSVEIDANGNKSSRIDIGMPVVWVVKENYLIVGFGEGEAQNIAKRLGGSVPEWLVAAKKAVKVPRPASFVHVDVPRVFSMVQDFLSPSDALLFTGVREAFGFNVIESFSYSGGLDDEGTTGRGVLKLSGELSGILTLLDCEPLVAADFEGISSESPFALVFQLNLGDALTAFLESCEHEMAPEDYAMTAAVWRQNLKTAFDRTGVDLHKDFLSSIGGTWRLFVQPGPEGFISGWTFSIDLSDSEKFKKTVRKLLVDYRQKAGNGGPFRIVSQKNEQAEFHSVHIPGFPLVLTWAIYEDRLLIATSTIAAHHLLTADAPEKSLADSDEIRPFLEDGQGTLKLVHLDFAAVMKLAVPLLAQQLAFLREDAPIDASILPPVDVVTKYLRPAVIAVRRTKAGVEVNQRGTLPGVGLVRTAPLVVGSRIAMVGGPRNAARAVQSTNNLKQIGLAMHNFHDTHGAFPAGYSADENGKPLLSWRVHILPFIEEQRLYEQFHLDEPWDSPHNKKLIARMPEVYKSPKSKAARGKTVYLGVGGADGVFVRPQDGNHLGTGMRDITDGTSNTIMTVEVSDERAVEWTRPGDFAPKKEDPQKGLAIDPKRGMSVGFTDGSVRNIGKDIAKETLMKLFTKSGGEVVEAF